MRSRIISAYVPIWLLGLVIIFRFCQFYFEIGVTVRAEDLVLLVAVGLLWFPALFSFKFRYRSSPLDSSLIVWCLTIIMGIVVTLLNGDASSTLKTDAIAVGSRLILVPLTFWLFYHHPSSYKIKVKWLFGSVIGFSFITTAVCLLQIVYWEGLSINLPTLLTELKEGANNARGREIFGLYVHDTGTHVWSALLAMQALCVWILILNVRHRLIQASLLSYFCLLFFILIRISVRNSILGLFLAVSLITLLLILTSQYEINRLLKITFIVISGLCLFIALYVFASELYFLERIIQALPQFDGRSFAVQGGSNIYGRIRYMRLAWNLFLEHPVLGGGIWSFEAWTTIYSNLPANSAHNSFIHTLAELGVVGLLALLWLLWRIGLVLFGAGKFFYRTHRTIGHHARLIWQLTLGNFIFLLFTALFANPFWQPQNFSFTLLLVALVICAVEEEKACL